MLTALGSDSQRHAGFTAGADDYVIKPFNMQELLDRASVWTRACRRAPDPAPAPAVAVLGRPAPALAPLAAPAPEPRAPADWCRQMLTAVREQPTQGRDIAALEMLLTACIELAPTPEEFGDLLASHAACEQPGIAETARVLQRAWRREQTGGDPPTAPSFQETLRTLGGLLDQSGAAVARVAVTPDSAEVQAYHEAQERHLDRQDLAREIGQWRARGGRAPRTDPTSPSRYETLLRAVGLMLDSDPVGAYDLVVTPRQIVVDIPAGGSQIFTVEQLTALLRASVQGREAPAPADA
jgi:CheY-like chemotaxis protein